MTGKTIASSSAAITLSAGSYPGYVPLSITSTGRVTTTKTSAIYSNVTEPWVVINAGTISSTKAGSGIGGIVLKAGGTVSNLSSGLVSGVNLGVYISGSDGGSITNSGTIRATGATGVGVRIKAAHATLVDAGTISVASPGYTAISLSGSADVLVLDPGFYINGYVSAASSDVLSLASAAATGTISGLGTSFTGFGTTSIEAGAAWTLYGSVSGHMTNAGTLTIGPGLGFDNASIVNNNQIIGYQLGLYSADTLTNNGTVTSTSTNPFGRAILALDAVVTNNAGALISGPEGIYDPGSGTTVYNAGTIDGSPTGGEGAVALRGGGNVTNAASGLIDGYYAVNLQSGIASTVVNEGTILGQAQNGAVYLDYTGSRLTNAGGTISGSGRGVFTGLYALYSTVTNTGSITGGIDGVGLEADGTVINTTSGTNIGYIDGGFFGIGASSGVSNTIVNLGTIYGIGGFAYASGVDFFGAGGTVVNGTTGATGAVIVGSRYGVHAQYQAVTLTNFGTIIGQTGFQATDSGPPANNTVINAGTIESTYGMTGTAVQFGGGDNRLVADPGAVFIGTVVGGSGTNTLELAAGGPGTLYGLGTYITNFQTLLLDASTQWTLTGCTTLAAGTTIDFASDTSMLQFAPTHIAATIDGFATGDTIALTGVGDATGVTVMSGNTLEVTRADTLPVYLSLDPTQNLSDATFQFATQGGNAIITADDLACFAEDTRIATPQGPVMVQALRPGDLVCAASGGVRPVRWIGWRSLDLARHPAPDRAQPIRIKRDAFAAGVPHRDLRLSPDHAVLLDGMLIPIRLLLNGASIVRETTCQSVIYYHVELDAHDVLLAEGAAAESYLDTGNRAMFENAAEPMLLHPLFAHDQERREAESCAPFVDDADRVEPLWHRLAQRATALGLDPPDALATTDDPALCIVAGTQVIRPLHHHNTHYIFMLPAGAREVRIVSRTAAPCEQRPWIEDRRQLGVMVSRLLLRAGESVEPIPLDHPRLGDGWWDVERSGQGIWRWTDGDAYVPLPGASPATLEIDAAGMPAYTTERAPMQVASNASA